MPVAASAELILPYHLSNYFHKEPLLDWLKLYGPDHGFQKDEPKDPETDMGLFLKEKSGSFRLAVLRCLREKGFDCVDLSQWSDATTRQEASARTIEYLQAGAEVIYRGTLIDEEAGVFATPDFLIRSDVLCRVTDDPQLADGPLHHRIVNARFSGLRFNADGETLGSSSLKHKAKLLLENRALAKAQGTFPSHAYLLGRTWSYVSKGVDFRGKGCLERLAAVDMNDPSLATELDRALAWLKRVRAEGAQWQIYPQPSIPELWPNSANTYDGPWHTAKSEIAQTLKDPNLLWNVGADKRDRAVANGILTFSDPRATAADFGIAGPNQAPILDAFLATIRSQEARKVFPHRVNADRDKWGTCAGVEFYVDFETVSNLDDDFSAMPAVGGQALIFMIGCGHMEDGKWTFRCFTTDLLNEVCEAQIIDEWLAHMEEVRLRLAPGCEKPLCFHWSPAEKSNFLTQYNSACARQPHKNWPEPNWYDFLKHVIKKEPVMVKDALSFGLKPLAKAMFKHGLIHKEWTDGPGDGLAAMVGAWRCNAKARLQGCSMRELPLMKSIEDYNEVDCQVMQQIVHYLREHH
ncbi:MAG: hypothetical protein ACAH95_00235 [Fimbriimonas sp.]